MSTLRVGTQNVHWPSSAAEIRQDIMKAKSEYDVVVFQEAYRVKLRAYLGDGWGVHQLTGPGNGDNAVAWRQNRATALHRGMHYIGKMNGSRTKTFKIAHATLRIDDKYTLVVGGLHWPHGVYQRIDPKVEAECHNNTEAWIKSIKHPLMLGGDWNSQLDKDPGNLANKTGLKWRGVPGRGIDGWLISDEIKVDGMDQVPPSRLHSDHPVVIARIEVRTNSQSKPPPKEPDVTPEANLTFASVHSPDVQRVADSNLKSLVADYDPDVLVIQDVQRPVPDLENFKVSYAGQDAVLWRPGKWQLAACRQLDISPGRLMMAKLTGTQRYWGPDLHVFSLKAPADNTAAIKFYKEAAKRIQNYDNKESVVLWGGHLGIARSRLPEVNLSNIWADLGQPNRQDDEVLLIGGHKNDPRVRPAGARINPQLQGVMAGYRVRGYSDDEIEPGESIDPEEGTPEEIPKSSFEKDEGPSADHSECCDGKSL